MTRSFSAQIIFDLGLCGAIGGQRHPDDVRHRHSDLQKAVGEIEQLDIARIPDLQPSLAVGDIDALAQMRERRLHQSAIELHRLRRIVQNARHIGGRPPGTGKLPGQHAARQRGADGPGQ